jgi:signal transduction histidine kinase
VPYELELGGRVLLCNVAPLEGNSPADIIGVIGISLDITERNRAEQQLKDVPLRLFEAEEKERRSISRELHDEAGQYLTALKLLIDKARISPTGSIGPVLDDASKMTSELLTDIRDLSLRLRPPILDDMGIEPSLLQLFERYGTQTGVKVNFTEFGLNKTLPQEIITAAYRIIQEALTNVARYAGVKDVDVSARIVRNILHIKIEDKGRGFSPAELDMRNSIGVAGMRERAISLGGKFNIESQPGSGTTVTAEIPVK